MIDLRIIVYATTDPSCPPAARFTARAFVDGQPMPVTFYGATEASARTSLSDWWASQIETERRRADAAAKRIRALSEARKASSKEGVQP